MLGRRLSFRHALPVAAFLFLRGASQAPEVCHGLNGEQTCEDYTYAGSLVEELPFETAFEEVLLLHEQLGRGLPYPNCAADLVTWMREVEEYYHSGVYHQQLIQMQNHIMSHHEEVAQNCPVAWLLTLLLKIESNLENGRQGRSCARVHATGCLRDARGYWKIYASMRAEYASMPPESLEPVNDLLRVGEARVLGSFRKSLGELKGA
eukprot:Skav231637  [mRNA]  locus=scaffold1135:162974:163594:+ [translate_table: standard]